MQSYANRVVILSHVSSPVNAPEQDRFKGLALPNLKALALTVRDTRTAEWVLKLFEAPIEDLELNWTTELPIPTITTLITSIGQRLTGLHTLQLCLAPAFRNGGFYLRATPALLESLYRLLGELKHLRFVALSFCLLSTRILETLAYMPSLEKLYFSLYFPTHRYMLEQLDPATTPSMFASLQHLSLDSSLASSKMLLDCVQSENMRRIDICSQVLDKSQDIAALFHTLGRHRRLEMLSVEVSQTTPVLSENVNPSMLRILATHGHEAYTLPASAWIPLADCHHLTSFHFTSTCLPRMQMDIFVDLVDAWRNLEELTITPLPVSVETPTRRSDLSLDALILISMKLARLTTLEISVNPVLRDPQILGQLFVVGPANGPLHTVNMGWSPWFRAESGEQELRPETLAALLDVLFPKLAVLEWDTESDLPLGRDSELTPQSRGLWKETRGHLEAIPSSGGSCIESCGKRRCMVCLAKVPPFKEMGAEAYVDTVGH